ncbi:hypothetical protein ACHWQZ_G000535 [Mnemiopsis leidyi]
MVNFQNKRITGQIKLILLLLLSGTLILLYSASTQTDVSSYKHKNYSSASLRSLTPRHQDPAFNLTLNPNKKLLLLLTSFRAGSSFLGQLFDSNPTVQYLFEPFYDGAVRRLYREGRILGARPDHSESDLRMLYLQQLLHNCTVYGTNFPERYERCGTPQENLSRFNSTECGDKHYKSGELYQEVCQHRPTTVLKVIRLNDVADLLKIQKIKTVDVRIVHLIRHPVPLMMSRRYGGLFFMWRQRHVIESNYLHFPSWRVKVALEMFDYCRESARTLHQVERDSWLRERYLTVTHGEMSTNPHQIAEKVYQFVGETMTESIREHISNITGGRSEGYEKRRENALEVFKNSTDLADRWRELGMFGKYWNLYSVEFQCRTVYKMLGVGFNVDPISRAKAFKTQSDIFDGDFYGYFGEI